MILTARSLMYFSAILAVITCCILSDVMLANDLHKRGEDIFYTGIHLSGDLYGGEKLTVTELRCANCHVSSSSPFKNRNLSSELQGGEIRYGRLNQLVSRRGGPPFRYQLSSFCQLLKAGVDPTNILVPRLMPRYELTDDDCLALWVYLGGD